MNKRLTKVLFAPVPSPGAFALPSRSPIFHAFSIHRQNAAEMYMNPVNSCAPMYLPVRWAISRAMGSENVVGRTMLTHVMDRAAGS